MKISFFNINAFAFRLFPVLLLFLAGACTRPVIRIENIPQNTPAGSRLFISGNFNRWDPGDVRYTFEMNRDSNYYYTLPNGFGNLEFKITRGEWSSVETDICGYDISNRAFNYRQADTIVIDILSWKDTEPINCPELTIVLDKIPENTPENEPLALAGNFNEWAPDSSSYLRRDAGTGKYMIKLPRKDMDRLLEFKVTRGNLLSAEADKFGYEIEKRQVNFGMVDTLFIDVENWEDLIENPRDRVTIILDKIPGETPDNAEIFITGSFNGWYPKDNKYKFLKNKKGQFEYTLPRESERVEFKITRGDWSKEEVDMLGYRMNNRQYEFGSADTVHLTIHGWLDQTEVKQPSYTVVLNNVPPTTPPNDNLYIAGSFNNWNSGQRKYRFTKTDNGKYYIKLVDAWRSIDYKITRGSWRSQEADEYGLEISNRHFDYTGIDTVEIEVMNWLDIPRFDQQEVVIVLYKVPQNTPSDKHIYITGTFNNWNPGDPDYILNKNLKGEYYITIPRSGNGIEYKFTLGSWELEELDQNGNTIPNRKYNFGYSDTLKIKIDQWEL
ncbi:MAG: hypothetical protein K9H16_00250 [Bacteroidales bacterium]|nr:hypothetical protein [Bacteroidales bacterium]